METKTGEGTRVERTPARATRARAGFREDSPMTGSYEGYVYRFYCGQCKTTSEWGETPDEARELADEHEAGHEELYYSTRIQQYPEDDPVVARSRG